MFIDDGISGLRVMSPPRTPVTPPSSLAVQRVDFGDGSLKEAAARAKRHADSFRPSQAPDYNEGGDDDYRLNPDLRGTFLRCSQSTPDLKPAIVRARCARGASNVVAPNLARAVPPPAQESHNNENSCK